MSMKPLNGQIPLGKFDALDAQATSCKGGEVATLVNSVISDGDKGAADVDDGYVGLPLGQRRPVATTTLASGNRPLFLVDEGTSGYGTLFGSVVGGTAGQVTTGGAVLGPHTATGSGKWTLWSQAGLYAISLDAVDTSADGLIPGNNALDVGDPLYANTSGVLTPVVGESFESDLVVGRLVSFETNGGSLVTTPRSLVTSAYPATTQFTHAVIWFQVNDN